MTATTVNGLIDASCAVTGYRESVQDDLMAGPRAVDELLRRHGVVAIREPGSGFDAVYRFRAAGGDGVSVVGGGPRLVDGDPRLDGDRPVRTDAEVRATLDALAAEGADWVSLRGSGEFLDRTAATARRRGMRVAARGPTALEAAERGHIDLVEGVVSLAPTAATPVEALQELSLADPAALSRRLANVAAAGAALTTELVALRRAAFVKESIAAPYLDDVVPILPHARYLIQMRQAGGYLAGRRALARHSGLVQPSSSEAAAAREGWARLTEVVAAGIDRGVDVLPASRAPQLSVVPGYGLLEEVALLVDAGVPTDRALDLAGPCAALRLGVARDVLAGVRLSCGGPVTQARDIVRLRPISTC